MNQELVKELFEYRDGVLYWKKKAHLSSHVKMGDVAGCVDHKGYLKTTINCKRYFNHRITFLMFHGWLPIKVDHADNNPSNNRIDNLRPATTAENAQNSKIHTRNISGFKNVYWEKTHKKWRVRFKIKGKKRNFGLYDDLELADLVAQESRNKYHGAFARHA